MKTLGLSIILHKKMVFFNSSFGDLVGIFDCLFCFYKLKSVLNNRSRNWPSKLTTYFERYRVEVEGKGRDDKGRIVLSMMS